MENETENNPQNQKTTNSAPKIPKFLYKPYHIL